MTERKNMRKSTSEKRERNFADSPAAGNMTDKGELTEDALKRVTGGALPDLEAGGHAA